MPEKSVREMNEFERRHYSLAARTFHATVMGAALLGLVAFAIGLGLYTYALVNRFIAESFSTARSTAAIVEEVVDVRPLAEEVMAAYRAQSADARAQTGTEEYRERFAYIPEREDYQTLLSVLRDFQSAGELDAVYMAMYDAETGSMVYIADPSETDQLFPGEWESVTREGMEKFLAWDGTGALYDIGKTEAYGWLCTSGMPIRTESGEPAAFVLADVTLESVGREMRLFVLQYSIAIAAATFLIGYLLTRHMKKTLVAPVNAIAQAAQEYVRDKRSGSGETEHFSLLNIKTGDEIENLSLIMADMEHDLAEYEENLTTVTAEKERIHTELSLATRIQTNMLPNIFPAFPERKEFDLYASMEAAREVGGDFFDFFLIDADHLCIEIADVAGKGIPAALFMMASKIILANNAMIGKSPGRILTDTNTAICSNNREEMFVTVWVGILELSTGKLTAANAGHEYPAVLQADGTFGLLKDQHGFVLGGMEGMEYEEYELQLTPGSKVFLYTDGVSEASDAENNMFGLDRMLAALNAYKDASAEEILKGVRERISEFAGDAEQFDDLTMLCLEYKGKEK